MSILARYDKDNPIDLAEKIVFLLMTELLGRRGFDWRGIDNETEKEWLNTWSRMVRQHLGRGEEE